MADTSEKVPIALAGPEDVEQCLPPAYTAVTVKPSSNSRLLRIGAVVLISGALLLLFGSIGAFYFWKPNDKHVYNVHYTMSINGKVQEGSMEIDSGNNLETFKTGAGNDEAVEVHDFQIVSILVTVTKHYEDEIMPAKFDENSLIWVAADQPVKDSSFLSPKLLELCADLPIFWLRPTYPKEHQRGKREIGRKVRQAQSQFEAAAEERNARRQGNRRSQVANETQTTEQETPFNPENPYHLEGEGGMTFDPMLDHQGVCCIECRRSYTHCQRICEPLGGYYPWPYSYQGCRSACRIVMPCSWWVARILGVV
uniref:Leukocyte cell-derived chemotaxin 1 n=1 Tax=Xenopus tropicalis TaxID=8364 RepID=A0A6I8R0L6_XENTR